MLRVSVKMNTFGWMLWLDRAKARISKYQMIPIPRKRRMKITIWSILLDLPPPLFDDVLQVQRLYFYLSNKLTKLRRCKAGYTLQKYS